MEHTNAYMLTVVTREQQGHHQYTAPPGYDVSMWPCALKKICKSSKQEIGPLEIIAMMLEHTARSKKNPLCRWLTSFGMSSGRSGIPIQPATILPRQREVLMN